MGIIVAAESSTAASARTGIRVRVPALTRVANRPLLAHVVDDFVRAAVSQIVVATGTEIGHEVENCLAECADSSPVPVKLLESSGPIDFLKAARMAAPIVGTGPCIVHDGSGLLGDRLDEFLPALDGEAPDVVLLAHHRKAREQRLTVAAQRGLHVVEADAEYDAQDCAGVFLLGDGAIQCLAGVPPAESGAFAEHIGAIGGSVRVRFVDNWYRYSGAPDDLLTLNRIALDRLEGSSRLPISGDNRFEGRLQIHETAIVESSVIVGPAVIGPGARVMDAYVGPYTSVGENARVEGVEIERSIIAAGASVVHVGGRLSGSVIGPNARVYRDFSLPRAIRLWVGEGDEVALA
jgi:glucose-1-phosphate thymidylyltransferase